MDRSAGCGGEICLEAEGVVSHPPHDRRHLLLSAMKWHPLLVAFVVGGCVLGARPGRAEYAFTLIADSESPVFSKFDLYPSINSEGTVVFHANLDSGGSGIFTGNGGPTTSIADSNGSIFSSLGTGPSINSLGTVAFQATLDAGGSGIFTNSGGVVTTVADTSNPTFVSFSSAPSINSSGTVAFGARLDGGRVGIFTFIGGTLNPIVQGRNPPVSVSYAWVNDANRVAFVGLVAPPGLQVLASDGDALMPIADTSGSFEGFSSAVGINSAGVVVFKANLDDGGEGIYTGIGGVPTTVIDTTNLAFSGFATLPSINSSGTVAFRGELAAGGAAVFISEDGTLTRVIGKGDSLDGGTIMGFAMSNTALNDAGQIAFQYSLSDGRSGVAVATPIPEPATVALLAIGALMSALRRQRKEASSSWSKN